MHNKERIRWIDIAKGICMISVVAGHLSVKFINYVVFSYHLTVFFLLSGYTLKNNLSVKNVTKRFRSLMVPYFYTCIAVTCMDVVNRILLYGDADFVSITKKVGYDLLRSFLASGSIKTFGTIEVGGRIGAIWFLPATFFAVVFVQVLLKYVADRKYRYAISIACAMLGCISAKFIWFPFSIQSAMLAAPLVLLGYDFKQLGNEWLSPPRVRLCFAVFVAGIALKITPVYYVTASMPDYLLSMICALASSACVIFLAQKLERCKVLAWIGRNSIYYLCIHLFEMETMGVWFQKLLETMNFPYNAGTRFVVKIIFISTATMLIKICQRKWPRTSQTVEIMQNTRDPALDVAKAGLIVLMIIGHFSVGEQFRTIVYSFHMMAFVFYSGYCFRPGSSRNLSVAIRKQVKSFLVPYAFFGVAYMLLTHDGYLVELERVVLGISFTNKLFTDVQSIGPVYFILLLFLTKVVYLFVERFSPNEISKVLTVLGLSLLGQILGEKGYWLPWSADCALYALISYYAGYCFKKWGIMEKLCEHNYSYFVLSCIWVYMIYSGGMELAVRDYGSYGVTLLGAISASALIYMGSRYLCQIWNKKVIEAICFVGQNTLYILIVHKLLSGYIGRLVSVQFTKGSIFYAAAMVLLQLICGCLIGGAVMWIRRRIVKR